MRWPPEPGDLGQRPDGGGLCHFPPDPAAWRDWLGAHHHIAAECWLVLPKKGSGLAGVSVAAAVEEALCWGWIDSRPLKIDDRRWALRFTPRKVGSVWSKVNKGRIARLIADGRMQPAGLAKIEAAQRDGSWATLDAADAMELPADLEAALRADPLAAEGFNAIAPSQVKQIIYWVGDARNSAPVNAVAFGAYDLTDRCVRLTGQSLSPELQAVCNEQFADVLEQFGYEV